MSTRLVLIRHGHSMAQERGIVGGPRTGGGLSAQGRRQVERLAARFTATGELGDVDAIYTSTMPRAIETADILAAALNPGSAPLVDDDLCEIREPARDGQPRRSRQDVWAEVGFGNPSSPGAESYEELHERASAALERIAAKHASETVVVATHLGVVRSAMAVFGQAPLGGGFLLAAGNASITELAHDPVGNHPFTWKLVRYNDTAHLNS